VADTGAPWNLPYPESTDLVRDGAQAIEDLAEAVADGLDAAVGLVAVKHALFTGTQTNSTEAGANFAVTNLSITHTLANASNKLIISAYFGVASNTTGTGECGLAVTDGGTLIGAGAAEDSRTRVSAAGRLINTDVDTSIATSHAVTFVYEPGDTDAHTYDVRAVNHRTSTTTLTINRNGTDADSAGNPRGTSGLVIQEVKV
jgi:hypothetical protein